MVASLTAYGREDEAVWQFHTGRTAFEAQNYSAALEAFEAAAAAGLPGPAVHFNIGVAAYRLGRYERARTAFQQAASTPEMAALAHYNLGLVALRQGDQDAARKWFELTRDRSADERLRSLAFEQLATLPPPPTDPSEDRNWIGYAAFDAGYDDNVALVSDSNVLGVSDEADAFAEAQLAFSAPLSTPWRADVGLTFTDYQDLDQFDLLSVYAGGRYRLVQESSWPSEIGLQAAYTTLDHEGFENTRTLQLQTSTALPADLKLRLRYRLNDIDGLNSFDGIGGLRHEASARVTGTYQLWDVGAEYALETGDYNDDTLSATRHEIGIEARRPLPAGWSLAVEATHRHSRYDAAGIGSEDLNELAIETQRTLTAQWRLVLRYAYADNDADSAEFDYARSRISAGVEGIW